jgi:hypothetical protein
MSQYRHFAGGRITILKQAKSMVWKFRQPKAEKGSVSPPFSLTSNTLTVDAAVATTAEKPVPKTFCLAFDLLSFFKRFHAVSPLIKWPV